MNQIPKTVNEVKTDFEFSKKYCNHLLELIDKIDHNAIDMIVKEFLEAEKNSSTIFFLGNGGSAATATHFACDLGKGTKTNVNIFKTQALADNFATFTAYANDHGYEYGFSKQLENVLKHGDVVVLISASGNSLNLINAAKYANEKGAKTIGLLGFDGGMLKDLCKIKIIVQTKKGEYGHVEDIHMILNHIITSNILAILEKRKN